MQQEMMGETPPAWQITRREPGRWEAAQQRDDGTTATITLICGDCLEGMSGLQPGSIDVVVTSPPYNLGIRYSRYDDSIPREEYLEWIGRWAAAVKRVLAPQGSLFLNVGSKPSDPWVPLQVALRVGDYLQLQNTIHWVKSIAIDPETMGRAGREATPLGIGHFKPINSARFLNDCHEYIFHFTHAGDVPLDRLAIGVPYQDKSNVRRWRQAADDVRCRGNTWFIPYDTIQNGKTQRPHPASFPIALPEWCYRLHGSNAASLCMDPFLGIGSSALAAARLGLSFIGFELDEGYFAEAVARLEARACHMESSQGRGTAGGSRR
ncbi:MAG TPA: site-specific DNA-methyltransferase [Armatimonadota bacterium]|nr:site-specific DNA-methyltransferase [Armatimonadota bacterium]HOM83216.1 site-specific DNA-methyltransferase [Armatimonadota bacterium]HPO72546.1 site-specific DNA-methyltransferase [Armatimonadota bacterium]